MPHAVSIVPHLSVDDLAHRYRSAHDWDRSLFAATPPRDRPGWWIGGGTVGAERRERYRDADRPPAFPFSDRGGCAVGRRGHRAGHGYYQPSKRLIALSDRLSCDQRTKTLVHEAAHYLADHRGQVTREDAETVAESSAFVVLAHYHIDSGSYSLPYVAR